MHARRHRAIVRRELLAAERIPYAAHVASNLVKTVYGDYVQMFRLGGAQLRERRRRAAQHLARATERTVAEHRQRPSCAVGARGSASRSRALSRTPRARASPTLCTPSIRRRLVGQTLMVNEFYLAVVYRPTAGAATRSRGDGCWRRPSARPATLSCAMHSTPARSSARHSRHRSRVTSRSALGVYRRGAAVCSRLLEFLGLSHQWRMAADAAAARPALRSARHDAACLSAPRRWSTARRRDSRVGAMLGIKEYPTPSVVGMYDRLLSAPFAFVLTQSFTFLTKSAGQRLLQRQFNRMANAGDFAVSQAEELKDALDALTSNEFVMGDHHFTLQVLADLADGEPREPRSARLKVLDDHVALARSLLADTGMTVAREDLVLEAAFWAQLPGNFPLRTRKAPITSRNFCAMVAFHNYPAGRATRQSLGRGARASHHERALALLLFACTRAIRGCGWRQPQGHRPHVHLRAHWIRQDGVHRLPGRDARAPRGDPGDIRQGPRS